MDEIVANFTLNNEMIDAQFDITDAPEMDAVFKIEAAGTTWGSIDGNIENQTDLSNALNNKADASTVSALSETVTQNTTEIATINATLTTFGDIVTHDVDEFATAAQGALADTALQPNALDGYATENWVENKGYITDIDSSDVTTALGYTPQAELTAGTNITIEGNTISASGTADYVAGDNIQINGNTISATDTIYTAGANVIIEGNTISAVSTSYIAGDNITIQNGTISATDTTYLAGSGITIENGTISAQATSYTAGNGITINGNTIATDTTIASKTDIGNATLTIYGNDTSLGTFSANATSATTVTVPIPTTATEVGALPSDTTIEDLTTESQQAALDSGITNISVSQIATNTSAISDINDLIPNDATTANQLATEGFVNSSISTNTANFIGTFNSVAELEAYSGTLTNNDYAFVATTDSAGNTLYDRYKWNGSEWLFEYELNNSSFTSDQWAAINSGVTASSVSAIAANTSAISGKQDALTAGDNITIQNGTISATDTTYSAGANVQINGNTISATDTVYTLPVATSNTLGGVIVGSNLTIGADGTLDALGTSYSQGNGIEISGNTISVSTTIASKTDIGNANLTIYRNSTPIGTFSANATSPTTVTVNVPTTASDVNAVPTSRTINGKTLSADVTLSASDVGALENIATGSGALNIIGSITGGSGSGSVSIGYDAKSTNSHGIAIGYGAVSANSGAIQIGEGTNNTKTSLYVGFGSQVGNYRLLDGTTGLIPDARISSNIARTSAIPSAVTETTVSDWGFTKNEGTVTSVNGVSPVNGNVTIPTGGTVDQTFSPSSANAQSGVAINGALSPFIAITAMGRTGTAWYCEFSNGEIWQGDVTPTGVTSYAVTLPYEMDISGGEYNIELTTLHGASDTGGYNAISVVSAYPSGVLSTGFTISQATADYTCWTVRGKKKVS